MQLKVMLCSQDERKKQQDVKLLNHISVYNFKGKGWKASWSRITIKYSDILAKILNWM